METVKALRLQTPVCPSKRASRDDLEEPHLVQLYVGASATAVQQRARVGCAARVTGELFEAESGHHHTPVVLAVTGIEVFKGCDRKPADRSVR